MSSGHQHHPAQKALLVSIVALIATIVLGFIAVFVPWAMKDIKVGTRAWAYPFKTCLEDTYSKVNAESCMDNDFMSEGGVPVTGGSATCKGFILATIAFVFISVIGGVLTLLCMLYVLDQLWRRPVCVAVVAQFSLVLICISCFLAWIMWICYAENTCMPNSFFPVQGYSYGFIIYIFATATSLVAVVAGFMAVKQLKGFVPVKDTDTDGGDVEPQSPIQYPVYDHDVQAPLAPTPQPMSFNDQRGVV